MPGGVALSVVRPGVLVAVPVRRCWSPPPPAPGRSARPVPASLPAGHVVGRRPAPPGSGGWEAAASTRLPTAPARPAASPPAPRAADRTHRAGEVAAAAHHRGRVAGSESTPGIRRRGGVGRRPPVDRAARRQPCQQGAVAAAEVDHPRPLGQPDAAEQPVEAAAVVRPHEVDAGVGDPRPVVRFAPLVEEADVHVRRFARGRLHSRSAVPRCSSPSTYSASPMPSAARPASLRTPGVRQ